MPELTQIQNLLLQTIVSETPPELHLLIRSAMDEAYQEADLLVANMGLNPHFDPYAVGQNRHQFLNRNLENFLAAAGFEVSVKPTDPVGYYYVEVVHERFSIISTRGDNKKNPKTTAFRERYREQTVLLDLDGPIPTGHLRLDLTHGPSDDDMGTIGYADLCLVASNGWMLKFDFLAYTNELRMPSINKNPVEMPLSANSAPEPVVQVKLPNEENKEGNELPAEKQG
jgi:hypothetical protein